MDRPSAPTGRDNDVKPVQAKPLLRRVRSDTVASLRLVPHNISSDLPTKGGSLVVATSPSQCHLTLHLSGLG